MSPQLQLIFRFSRPTQLLLLMMNAGIGLGLARYLGVDWRLDVLFFGGLSLLFSFASSNLLTEYFRPTSQLELPFIDDRRVVERFRLSLLTSACAFLAGAVALFFIVAGQSLLAWVLFGLFVVCGLVVALPPLRLEDRGFSELFRAFVLAVLTPAVFYVLLDGKLHRLVALFTLPTFLLGLAALIAMRFQAYTDDLKYKRVSLLTRLTWERAVSLHNGLLVLAYLVIVCLPFLGVPVRLTWPGLLTLPIAAIQLYLLRNISDGGKPLWNQLRVAAFLSFGLTAYLFGLVFWIG